MAASAWNDALGFLDKCSRKAAAVPAATAGGWFALHRMIGIGE
jgi:hypothetical protein